MFLSRVGRVHSAKTAAYPEPSEFCVQGGWSNPSDLSVSIASARVRPRGRRLSRARLHCRTVGTHPRGHGIAGGRNDPARQFMPFRRGRGAGSAGAPDRGVARVRGRRSTKSSCPKTLTLLRALTRSTQCFRSCCVFAEVPQNCTAVHPPCRSFMMWRTNLCTSDLSDGYRFE